MKRRVLLTALILVLALAAPAGALTGGAESVRLRSDSWACAGLDVVGALCLEDPWRSVPDFDLLRLAGLKR